MNGIVDLKTLLRGLEPKLHDDEFVFVCRPCGSYGDGAELSPVASFVEDEGLTLVVRKSQADDAGEIYQGVFRMITLRIHSSLQAVGLTAAVTEVLSKRGISVNVIAAVYHDHLLVPTSRAVEAYNALEKFALSTP